MELVLNKTVTFMCIRDYFILLKPCVMSLVVFTGAVAMFLAPGHISSLKFLLVLLSIALGGGAAGALNMWLERDTDAFMERTRNRPLPAGRISSSSAKEFALACAALSLVMMAIASNVLATILLLGAILFYVFVYTLWLKPRTPMNIVIGGAAGAFPPVIGWAAVTGSVSFAPVILFLIIFLWTPPHFWSLALVRSDDYQRAGIPMLPVVAGHKATRIQMLVYTVLLLPVSMLPYYTGMARIFYMAGTVMLGLGFIFHAIRLWRSEHLRYAMPMFGYSLFYLFGIFALLVLDRMFGG